MRKNSINVNTYFPNEKEIERLIHLFFNKQYEILYQQLTAQLTQFPKWLDGWKMLSDTCLMLKKDASAPAYQALLLNQQDPKEHCYYGLVLKSQHDLIGAAKAFEKAIALKPDYVEAINNLGIVNKDMGDYAKGIHYFQQALTLSPNYASCFSNLLFCLSHDEQVSTQDWFDTHVHFGQLYQQTVVKHSNTKAPARTLNIGFVSSCYREHSLANFIAPLLPYLQSNDHIQLFAYSNHPFADDTTEQLKTNFDYWRQVDQDNDMTLVDKIQADSIDILIDLDGHTADNRLTAFAFKPAPIQMSWLGYLATSGLTTMDYYLADSYLLPPKQFDQQFTEKLVQLPVNAPFLPSPLAPDINALPALTNGYITYGCFNRINKINRSTIDLWSQILNQDPTAKLLLIGDKHTHSHLLDWFQQNLIKPERLIFLPRADMATYLTYHHQVDICLDTMPSNGVTTTCHAAWMGIPTLCIAGDRMSSRGAQAIMQHLGLTQFTVENSQDLVMQSATITKHLQQLATVRQQLRDNFKQSWLNQPQQAAEALNLAFRTMWKRWCRGKQAKSFVQHKQVKSD